MQTDIHLLFACMLIIGGVVYWMLRMANADLDGNAE